MIDNQAQTRRYSGLRARLCGECGDLADVAVIDPTPGCRTVRVFEHDVGQITAIDPQTETLAVCYDGKTATYGFEMLNELEHAWVMTVHKSQGSEYRAVVLCLCGGPQMLLTRSVLYTAITRARELLIIVGNEDVVAAMTRNDRRQRRYSGLKLRLEGKA